MIKITAKYLTKRAACIPGVVAFRAELNRLDKQFLTLDEFYCWTRKIGKVKRPQNYILFHDCWATWLFTELIGWANETTWANELKPWLQKRKGGLPGLYFWGYSNSAGRDVFDCRINELKPSR